MPPILDTGMESLGGLLEGFNSLADPLHRTIKPLRESLIKHGLIVPIPDNSSTTHDISLATVDGAFVVEQFAYLDMMVSGAAIGEGNSFKFLYEDNNAYPSTAFISSLQHDSKNSDAARALMAVQEMALLDYIDHDVKIMDGSWLSSATSLVLTFSQSEPGSRVILEYLLWQRHKPGWDGQEFIRTLGRVLSPWNYQDDNTDILALTKSDSSQVLTRRALENYIDDDQLRQDFERLGLMDRALASLVLHPGEMIKPLYIDAGRSLWPRIAKGAARAVNKARAVLENELTGWEQQHYSVRDIHGLSTAERQERSEFLAAVVRQSVQSGDDSVNDGLSLVERLQELEGSAGAWVWSTYFKPNIFTAEHKALRMEFVRDAVENETPEVRSMPTVYLPAVTAKAQRLASLVDADMQVPEILEPWSQYVADREAKGVSTLASAARAHLLAEADDILLPSILRGYRT